MDGVNFVIIFLKSQMTLLRWLTFLLGSLTVTVKVRLFWIYLFLLTLAFVLQQISLHWETLIILLPQFPLNFHQTQNEIPCFIAQLLTILALIGGVLRDNLRDVPQGTYLFNSVFLLLVNFLSGFRLGLMYISFIVNIRSSLTHYQLLLLLP